MENFWPLTLTPAEAREILSTLLCCGLPLLILFGWLLELHGRATGRKRA